MNAITPLRPDTASRLIAGALSVLGRPYRAAPDRAQCFDCVAYLNELTGAAIADTWMEDGGELPFAPVAIEAAAPGDILVFCMPWAHRPWHMAVMTAGTGIDDRRARIAGPYHGHACVEAWLAPMWRHFLVRAFRVEAL